MVLNPHEARLSIVNQIADTLFDISFEEGFSDNELRKLYSQMSDVADTILDELELEVNDVDGDTIRVTLKIEQK